ncbi:MAG TPA: serine hydrolase [Puia sp.]|nr:serine hydrolase [Puia sp.]
MKIICPFVFIFFISLSGIAQTSTNDQPAFIRDSLDSYILQGIKDWNVPGLSIVIVKDNKVVWMKGYGVRDIDSKKPVDENTLFMIASNTKLFTGSSLAMLETEGRLSLDDQITKYFPSYRLYDTTSTKLVSIRDMLSHRIGTKTFEGDFTFWNTSLSREEIMRRMQYLKPPFHFRQEFGYCNSCFLVAGQVIPVVTGETWEHYVQNHFLGPLGMDHTLVLSTGVADQPNVATPYTTAYTNQISRVPYDNWNNLAPAASIVSNVNDLSHWLFMQLDSGRYQGKQIISWPALQKTRIANTWVRSIMSDKYPTHFTGYGLGLNMQDYAGKQVYWHTGGAGGMVSNVCFVPEVKLGIAILTNNDNQGFFEDLRHQILDAYLGVPYVSRSLQDLPKFLGEITSSFNQRAGWNARVDMHNKAQLSLSSYTGDYNNVVYGKIHISQEKDHLLIQFDTKPDLKATLEYMDEGEWLLKYNNIVYGRFAVSFDLSGGKVKSLTTKQNPYVEIDPYVFSKIE